MLGAANYSSRLGETQAQFSIMPLSSYALHE